MSPNTFDALLYHGQMSGAYAAMSPAERAALHTWERTHLDGETICTSDWPGWEKYIGLPPWRSWAPAYKKQPISADLRARVFARDRWMCVQCGTLDDLSVDHIHPESKGGTLDMDNLQTLCRPCNSRKGARA